MSDLITSAPRTSIAIIDRFCAQCGNQVLAQDRFCRHCGTECHITCHSAELVPAQTVSSEPNSLPAQTNDGATTIQTVLNNRWAVMGIVAVIGPLGLPAVWFCPRFSSTTKILITAFYFLLTAVVPIVFVWWMVEDSVHPLVDAFGSIAK